MSESRADADTAKFWRTVDALIQLVKDFQNEREPYVDSDGSSLPGKEHEHGQLLADKAHASFDLAWEIWECTQDRTPEDDALDVRN